MTIEERLREALTAAFRSVQHWPTPDQMTRLMAELSARGLTVCEITHRENVLEDREISNMGSGEQHKQNAVPLSCDDAKERMEPVCKDSLRTDRELAKPSELSPQTFGATPYVLDREEAIARSLYEDGRRSDHLPWISTSEDCKETWRALARNYTANDPWTKLYENQIKLRAEVERLRDLLRDVDEVLEFLPPTNGIVVRIRQALTEKQDG